VWAGVIGVAGLAALWHVDPWRLIVLALGVAAAGLGPSVLWRPAEPVATAAGILALVIFAVLTLVALLPGAAPILGSAAEAAGRVVWSEPLRHAALAYPALVAVPAGAAIALAVRPRRGRRAPAAARSVRS